MNDRKSETPQTDLEFPEGQFIDGKDLRKFACNLERRALKAEHACYVAGTDPDHALDVQIFELRDSLAAAHEQIAKMEAALLDCMTAIGVIVGQFESQGIACDRYKQSLQLAASALQEKAK